MHTQSPRKRSCQCLAAALLLLTVSACAPLPTATPQLSTATAQPTDFAVPSAELVPVEEITDLPTHAPTTTSLLDPAETSIPVSPEGDPNTTLDAAQAEIDILLGTNPTFEEAEVLIKRPGHLSRITSPFMVIAYVDPEVDSLVQVTLLGEDGRTLENKKVHLLGFLGLDNGNMITELNFSIEGLSELGRLEISIMDAFGRVLAFNSVDLILLSMGETDRNYTPEIQERIIIQYPLANYMVQGESLLVSGLVRTTSEQPLALTLIDENGELVGQGSASVILAQGEGFGLFIGEIAFSVEAPVWVRLGVAIPGERIPGFEFIKTMEIVVSP